MNLSFLGNIFGYDQHYGIIITFGNRGGEGGEGGGDWEGVFREGNAGMGIQRVNTGKEGKRLKKDPIQIFRSE